MCNNIMHMEKRIIQQRCSFQLCQLCAGFMIPDPHLIALVFLLLNIYT